MAIRITTAGESHGKALVAIVEGLPAHLTVDKAELNRELALRQSGYGRGGRQKIEKDSVEILSGVRNCQTLGSPVTLCIYNKDYENWERVMSDGEVDETAAGEKRLTKVRPGHADLTGVQKYGFDDARCVLERASARETAIRVAAGGICKQYLRELGVEICGFVKEICGVKDGGKYAFNEVLLSKENELGMLDSELAKQAKAKIDELKKQGDTAGGVVEIRVRGLKSGFGSYATYGEKLDAKIAGDLMSIQAVKGVEFGEGFLVASSSGKQVHDEIFYDETCGYYRKTNRAGGVEGGMSNGEEIVVRLAMKPIPTLMQGLQTVDIATKNPCVAASERSDVCAIFAMQIIAESVIAETLAKAVSERLGGDTIQDVKERYSRL